MNNRRCHGFTGRESESESKVDLTFTPRSALNQLGTLGMLGRAPCRRYSGLQCASDPAADTLHLLRVFTVHTRLHQFFSEAQMLRVIGP